MGATLAQLQYFVAVADARSFARAAAELRVPAATLSTQVRALEMFLGQPLVLRSTRRAELTPAGAELYATLSRSLRQIDKALDDARASDGATTLHIAFTSSAGYELLPALLDELQLSGHDPHTQCATHREVLRMVADGKAHAGLVRDARDADGLRVDTVHRERMAVFLSERHLLARRASLEARDLRQLTLIAIPDDVSPAFTRVTRRLCEAHGFAPRMREVKLPENRDALYAHLADHPRVAFLGPACMANSSWPGVRRVALDDPEARINIDLVTTPKRSRRAQIIADACREVAAREGWAAPDAGPRSRPALR